MTSKNETGAFIKYFGNAKSQLTEPETVVRGILKDLPYGIRIQEPIAIQQIESDVESGWPGMRLQRTATRTFVIDLFIPEHKICVEVDGIHHFTHRQERKTAWRDAQLIANGYKVLHIDSQYAETKELQEQLKPLIAKALDELKAGKVQTKRIVA